MGVGGSEGGGAPVQVSRCDMWQRVWVFPVDPTPPISPPSRLGETKHLRGPLMPVIYLHQVISISVAEGFLMTNSFWRTSSALRSAVVRPRCTRQGELQFSIIINISVNN